MFNVCESTKNCTIQLDPESNPTNADNEEQATCMEKMIDEYEPPAYDEDNKQLAMTPIELPTIAIDKSKLVSKQTSKENRLSIDMTISDVSLVKREKYCEDKISTKE